MITAARHGKLRNYDLYEDEITSIIFGPMQYFPARDVWEIFRNLSGYAGINFWPIKMPESVKMHFWPKTGPVEPDLVIQFYRGEENILNIILEVKWDAPLSPLCELVRQWGHRGDDKSEWIHLYLVKDVAKRHADIQQSLDIALGKEEPCAQVRWKCCCDMRIKQKDITALKLTPRIWSERLGCVGWRHVLKSMPAGLKNTEWQEGAERFLGKHDFAHLTGFDWLNREALVSVEDTNWFNK